MRSSTLALLLLISVQAVLNMGGGARGRGASQQHHVQSGSQGVQDSSAGDQNPQSSTPFPVPTTNPKLLAGILKAAHTSGPTFYNTTPSSNSTADPKPASTDPKAFSPKLDPKHSEESPGVISVANPELRIESPDSIPTVDPRVFSKRRYRSPRVLFSAHPPDTELGEARGTGPRVRRRAGQTRHRGVYSVCDSVSNWVGNKTKAVDIKGNEVTVLPDVRINDIVKKQYFFETTCLGARRPSPTGGSSSCLGIDGRHWNSYCTNTHTFVLAMTSFKSVVAWRLIRINAACVCVLSRKSWRH